MKLAIRLLSSVSALYLLGGTAQAQPPAHSVEYCLTHVWTRESPAPEEQELYFTSMNDRGELVGYVRYGEDVSPNQAVLWRKGQLIDLGARIGHAESRASAINDHGDVVGSYSDDGHEFHAFMLRHGRVVDIEGVPGEGSTLAFDINNKRQVIVGRTERPELPNYATASFYLWKRGSATLLEPLEPADGAYPNHMNDRGITAGISVGLESTAFRPVLWQDGTVMSLGMPEGAESADALDINNRGQVAVNVVTHVEERYFIRPYIWHEGEFTELQLMGDAPYGAPLTGINDRGVAIGSTSTIRGESVEEIPTVWRNGQAADLNTLICSGDPLQPYVRLAPTQQGAAALLINNRGQILATGYDSRSPWGSYFLLTPKR
jgi:probable HAF family extracellular repeat protein